MISDQVKIHKRECRTREREAAMKLAGSLVTNPVVELIAGYAIVEYLGKHPEGKDKALFGTGSQTVLEGLIGAAVVSQQLGPENSMKLLEGIGSGINSMASGGLKIAATALAAGGL